MPNVYIISPAQMGGSFIVLLYLSSYFRLLMATESKAETPESWNPTNQDSFKIKGGLECSYVKVLRMHYLATVCIYCSR